MSCHSKTEEPSTSSHSPHRLTDISTSRTPKDSLIELEAMKCIARLANVERGLELLLSSGEVMATLVLTLDSHNLPLKIESTKLFALVTCFSESAHSAVLDALNLFKKEKNERVRFQRIIRLLGAEDSLEYKIEALSLINAIVNVPSSLERRLALRQEFYDLDFKNLIIILRVEDSPGLNTQLDVFLEEADQDERQRDSLGILDPTQLVQALQKQVNGIQASPELMAILQSLMNIPNNDGGQHKWKQLSCLVEDVVAGRDLPPSLQEEAKQRMEEEVQKQVQHHIAIIKSDLELEKEAIKTSYAEEISHLHRLHTEEILALQDKVGHPQEVAAEVPVPLSLGNVVLDGWIKKQLALDKLSVLIPVSLSLKDVYVPKSAGVPKSVFSVELASLAAEGVPTFLGNIMDQLWQLGTEVEGLFKIPPSGDRVVELKNQTELGKVDFTDVDDPHVLGGLLKVFLKELPEPITTYALYAAFGHVNTLDSEDVKVTVIGLLLTLLPVSHRETLRRLLSYLHGLSVHAETNHMTAASLASAFGATLFKSKKTEISRQAFKQQKDINYVMQLMIQNADTILDVPSDIVSAFEKVVQDPVEYQAFHSKIEELQPGSVSTVAPPAPPSSPRGEVDPMASPRPAHRLPNAEVPKPSVAMKQVYWPKVNTREADKSIWNYVEYEHVAINTEEVETLFFAKAKQIGASPQKVSVSDVKHMEGFLEVNRANHIAIMLIHFKLSDADIKKAILDVDERILTLDRVNQLITYAPMTEEEEVLRNFKGNKADLGRAERFFLEIQDVPRYLPRLKSIRSKLQFGEQIGDLKRDIGIVTSACKELRASQGLVKILELTLALGNFMNYGPLRSPAVGFKISFLSKIADVRATDGKITLLDYIVSEIEKKLPQYLNINRDLAQVPNAAKLSPKKVMADLGEIKNSLIAIEREISKAASSSEDHFREEMKRFYDSAEREVKLVEQAYISMRTFLESTLNYFAEDDETSTEEFFCLITDFLLNFEKAVKDMQRERTLSEKKTQLERNKKEREGKRKEENLHHEPPPKKEGVLDNVRGQLRMGTMFRQRKAEMQAKLNKMLQGTKS
eukprot:TRINITY_DN5992_c0_g1_i2.p1 TRINITY_DN5992_c0_g1~~TRINITY_DN5992_c0_g1_i2.p1  ORF type:complete len:1081 (-),score=303.16 TRINITY_DN5992_c0_g1_i2:139-3381(-)